MPQTVYKGRIGPGPNYTYQWSPDPPANAEAIVDQVTQASVELKQERKTPGHYLMQPIKFTVPAGKARYHDLVIPDYTNGLDMMNVQLDTSQADTGDEICCGKAIIGQIGVLAAGAASGATSITVATTVPGLLKTTLLGGAIDEGFNVSIGSDATTDTDINATDPTQGLPNPSPEKKEYEIKRVGAETDAGNGTYLCTLTLFSGLAQAESANAAVNLVVPWIKQTVEMTKNGSISLGGETLTAGNVPANKRLRFGYKNTGASDKTVRAFLGMLY